MGQKNTFFQKRTGELIDSKEKWPQNEPEISRKRSGEVVEKIGAYKKRTETNRKTNLAMLLKIQEGAKIDLQRETGARRHDDRPQYASRKLARRRRTSSV